MKALALVSLNGGKFFPVEKDLILIGRQEACDLRIDHKSVSKHHCILSRRGDKLWLRDLGSTNGSHVNNKRVRRSELHIKDILGIAGFSFRLGLADEEKQLPNEIGGTKELSPAEVQRLQQKDPSQIPFPLPGSATAGPVVQVNTLPDEYTPTSEASEHAGP
jgi:pSer/pThr/pTyr-binding forkhead associated (FHA) protein